MLETSRPEFGWETLMDIGAELRAAREAKGLSLGTLAQRTRVQPRTLAAIEINDLAAIPPRPFGRGFVRAYAQEVSLDPERTVHNYFSQFPPAPEQPAPSARWRVAAVHEFEPPSQWTGLGAAAAILLVVVATALVLGRRAEAPAADPSVASTDARGAVGTTGTTKTAGAVPAAAPAIATDRTPAAPASASSSPLQLSFSVTRPCWVAATADGQRTIYRIVQSGERVSLTADREITARFGDAGAVAWSFNGRPGAPLGADGAVKDMHCRLPAADCRF
jgi:cytoskeleton protein RodZ